MDKSCLSSGETGKQQDPLSEKEASLCSATISEKQNTSCGCLFTQRKEHYDFLQMGIRGVAVLVFFLMR